MENNDDLLAEYRKTRDLNLRNHLVEKYMGIVKYVCVALRGAFAKYGDFDDLVNEGAIALISAIETFDPTRGAKFETYANLKIRGAVIDYVRKQDWIPRQVRKFSKDLDDAYNELYTKLGRTPTDDELAEYFGVTKEKLTKAMSNVAGSVTLSFEELLYEDNIKDFGDTGSPIGKEIFDSELKNVIAAALETLKPKAKQVVSLYYFERLKFSEIAGVLGVTEGRICQIHSEAMMLLNKQLRGYVDNQ